MKEIYEAAELELLALKAEDIVTASGDDPFESGGGSFGGDEDNF